MKKNQADLLKSLTKKLAIGIPVVALSGVLPGTDGIFMGNAAAEHHSEAGHKHKYKASAEGEAKSEAKAEAEAEGEAEAEAEAEGEAEGEAESEG